LPPKGAAPRPAQRMQQTARAGAEGPERVPGDEEDQLPALLLPVRRRAAGDPLADQGPAGRAAALAQVLREHLQGQVRGGHAHLRHVLGRERGRRLQGERLPHRQCRGLDVRDRAGHERYLSPSFVFVCNSFFFR